MERPLNQGNPTRVSEDPECRDQYGSTRYHVTLYHGLGEYWLLIGWLMCNTHVLLVHISNIRRPAWYVNNIKHLSAVTLDWTFDEERELKQTLTVLSTCLETTGSQTNGTPQKKRTIERKPAQGSDDARVTRCETMV